MMYPWWYDPSDKENKKLFATFISESPSPNFCLLTEFVLSPPKKKKNNDSNV